MTDAIKCMFILTLYQSSKCASGMNETILERRQMEGFVVGGDYTTITEYPHAVYLQMTCSNKAWICGSSILNQRIIITAAHCLSNCHLDNRRDYISIFAGSANIRETKYTRYGRALEIHQYYEERTVVNDIGLLLTDESIPLGRDTKRIIIKSKFPNEFVAYVAGWGSINDATGVSTVRLKHVFQKLRSRQTCQRIGHLHRGMLCAGELDYYEDHPAEDKLAKSLNQRPPLPAARHAGAEVIPAATYLNSCISSRPDDYYHPRWHWQPPHACSRPWPCVAGDSGSALITRSFIGIGLVSFRTGLYPALLVYTNITFYHGWIRLKAKQLYCN